MQNKFKIVRIMRCLFYFHSFCLSLWSWLPGYEIPGLSQDTGKHLAADLIIVQIQRRYYKSIFWIIMILLTWGTTRHHPPSMAVV